MSDFNSLITMSLIIICIFTVGNISGQHNKEKSIRTCIDNSLTIDAAYKCVGE